MSARFGAVTVGIAANTGLASGLAFVEAGPIRQ